MPRIRSWGELDFYLFVYLFNLILNAVGITGHIFAKSCLSRSVWLGLSGQYVCGALNLNAHRETR